MRPAPQFGCSRESLRQQLTKETLRDEYPTRNFVAGWRFRISFGETERRLDALLDSSFPFSTPRFSLVDRPPFLTWPHVERDGMLCLLPDTTPIDSTQPAALVEYLLTNATKLVADLEKGEHRDHLKDEFQTYWSQSADLGIKVFSLLNVTQRHSRLVQAWIGESAIFVGETAMDVSRWLEHRFGNKPKFQKTDLALILWIGEAFLPDDYPKNASDLLRLVRQLGQEQLFSTLINTARSTYLVILGFHTEHGPSFAAITFYIRKRDKKHPQRRSGVGSGFRMNRIPSPVQMNQFLASSGKAIPSMVERIDHNWVHGRDSDLNQNLLKNVSVAVLGCGSIGSLVAHQLAMAGVGKMYLIDPQILTSSNSGRHFLGARYLGKSKAISLASELQENFPHLTMRGFFMSWEEFRRKHASEFESCSTVLSLIGDWNSENLLNSVHLESGRTQDVLYGWTEDDAVAGHAVLIRSNGGCFCCHFDSVGNPERRLVKDTRETRKQEPACGALFQPYGPVELSSTVSLISNLALESLLKQISSSTHRIWKGSSLRLEGDGGEWDIAVINRLGIPHLDNLQHSIDWETSGECSMCGGSE